MATKLNITVVEDHDSLRAVTIEALQGAMRQLTAATENLTNATEQQRATIALTEAALKVAQARKWWQRSKSVGEG